MMAGTSPALTIMSEANFPPAYAVAFVANTGVLWTVKVIGAGESSPAIIRKSWTLAPAPGTSPAITGLSEGDSFQVAIEGQGNDLWTADETEFSSSYHHWPLGMMAGTSPAISELADGTNAEVAFQANSGHLWAVTPSFGASAGHLSARKIGNDLNYRMKAGTSPAVAGLAYGGFQAAFQADTGDLWTAGSALAPGASSTPPGGPRGNASATPHKKAAGTPPACNSTLTYTGSTWMGDLAPCLQDQKLADIVIPGSHDTTTFGLGSSFTLHDVYHTQDEWTSAQADDGARQFDIRVELSNADTDWYAHHGSGITDGISSWLTLQKIFNDIALWATTAGREHEVLLLNLTMGGTNDVAACQSFAAQMGDALVTPSELAGSFGTTDPGQLTLNQLWSLPDPNRYARVIINDAQCNGDVHLDAGTWTPSSSYYADQCTAAGESFPSDQTDGIQKLVLEAVKGRNANALGGEPSGLGPPAAGGYYVLSIQGTPELDCLTPPAAMVPDERTVLAALYSQWQTDPATKQNLNIVAGDYIEHTSLLTDAIAMNEAKFPSAPPAAATAASGDHQQTARASRSPSR
jgi:hypothetical protein